MKFQSIHFTDHRTISSTPNQFQRQTHTHTYPGIYTRSERRMLWIFLVFFGMLFQFLFTCLTPPQAECFLCIFKYRYDNEIAVNSIVELESKWKSKRFVCEPTLLRSQFYIYGLGELHQRERKSERKIDRA